MLIDIKSSWLILCCIDVLYPWYKMDGDYLDRTMFINADALLH